MHIRGCRRQVDELSNQQEFQLRRRKALARFSHSIRSGHPGFANPKTTTQKPQPTTTTTTTRASIVKKRISCRSLTQSPRISAGSTHSLSSGRVLVGRVSQELVLVSSLPPAQRHSRRLPGIHPVFGTPKVGTVFDRSTRSEASCVQANHKSLLSLFLPETHIPAGTPKLVPANRLILEMEGAAERLR